MRGMDRARRNMSAVQLGLLNQTLAWTARAVEVIPTAERTPEENEILRLIRLVRARMLDEFADPG
jgi:hypothetical protein